MNNQLVWIHEPAIHATDEEGMLRERLFGKRPDCFVAIHIDAMADSDATAREGRPVFRNVPMISIKNKGEKDFVSKPLSNDHLQIYPRAAKWWAEHKADAAKVSVRLLPGITPADVAELEALNVGDLATLADAEVPEALQPWRDLALRFRTLSKPRMRIVDGQLRAA